MVTGVFDHNRRDLPAEAMAVSVSFVTHLLDRPSSYESWRVMKAGPVFSFDGILDNRHTCTNHCYK